MIEFIVGLAVIAGVILVIWGLGKLGGYLNIFDSWYVGFWDIIEDGLTLLIALGIIFLVCLLMYALGNVILH